MTTLLYETVVGSRAYGLAREGSDTDLKGVIVGPKPWYFGHRGGPEQVELNADHVRYELRKFLRLVAKANPTALEMLFTDERHHRTCSPAGERLLASRASLLTRRVGESFGGYALGQLKRIRSHRRWFTEPEPAAPNSSSTPSERRRHAEYLQWRTHRNPARAALEARHGYDTKHAMHLLRLQRMALEILRRGEVLVTRDDRDELLAIRDGAWSYEALVERAEHNGAAIVAATKESPLPESIDEDALEDLGVQLIEEVLS